MPGEKQRGERWSWLELAWASDDQLERRTRSGGLVWGRDGPVIWVGFPRECRGAEQPGQVCALGRDPTMPGVMWQAETVRGGDGRLFGPYWYAYATRAGPPLSDPTGRPRPSRLVKAYAGRLGLGLDAPGVYRKLDEKLGRIGGSLEQSNRRVLGKFGYEPFDRWARTPIEALNSRLVEQPGKRRRRRVEHTWDVRRPGAD